MSKSTNIRSLRNIHFVNLKSEELLDAIENKQIQCYHFVAGSTFYFGRKELALINILNNGYAIVDSTILAWYQSIILKKTKNHVLRGSDFLRFVITRNNQALKHFFIGASGNQIILLKNAINILNPEFNFVGSYVPEYSESWENLAQEIGGKTAFIDVDVVWVGIGSPKQDFIINELSKINKCKFIAIGAALDFVSGVKIETPPVFRESGFEWLFRLILEPKRLWRRYFFGNLWILKIFVSDYFKQMFRVNVD